MVTLSVLLAAVAAAPQHYVLNTDIGIWDAAVQDIDGDGIHDVLAVCCDEDSSPLKKEVAVFLGDGQGGFRSEPDLRCRLDPSVGALFFAETDGEAPIEMVATNAAGGAIYGYRDGDLRKIADSQFISLLPDGSKEPLFFGKPMKDLDGDGVSEWLIPVPSGYEVRSATESITVIPCDVVSEIRNDESTVITHRLPAYTFFEMPGDDRQSIAFLSDEFADFAYGERWQEHRRFSVPINLDEKWEASTKMEDIDANGLPDLVVTQVKGTVNLKVLTQIYLASEPFTYPSTPTASFEVDGTITSPLLDDVNGDEKLDLMFIGVPFSIKNFVNYFMRNKLTISVDVHLFGEGGYPEVPTYHAKLTLDAPEGRERIAYTVGDFTGDGLLDVAVGQGSQSLALHYGNTGGFVSPKADLELPLPAFGIARPYDLDGNASDDIVIIHPSGPNHKRIEVLIFNGGAG